MDAVSRNTVFERAKNLCEYCKLHADYQGVVSFHVEHIIACQHHGPDDLENLALACHRCNLHKGTNLTGLDPLTGDLVRLFHPRNQTWSEHFELRDAAIHGLSPVGRTTAALLQMNSPDRIELRRDLITAGLWHGPNT